MKFLHHQVALDCPMILIQRLLGLGKGLFGNFQCTGPLRALQPFTSDGCRYPLNWQCLSSAGPEPQIIYVKTAARQTFSTVSDRFGNPTRDHPKQNAKKLNQQRTTGAWDPDISSACHQCNPAAGISYAKSMIFRDILDLKLKEEPPQRPVPSV